MSFVRENWRVITLTVMILVSVFALFASGGTVAGGGSDRGLTNLQYGIELDGGARIRAPIEGMTAEGVDLPRDSAEINRIERDIAADLGLEVTDVAVSPGVRSAENVSTVEVFSDEVNRSEFVAAMNGTGLSVTEDQVRDGVTEQTRSEVVRTIDRKINAAGLSGGSVRIATTTAGERFVVVEAPNRDIEDLRSLIESRGEVRVVAYYPNDSGTYVNETVMTQDMSFTVGPPSFNDRLGHHVPITFQDEEDAARFANALVEAGYGGGSTCRVDAANFSYGDASGGDRCLLTILDGEVVYAAGVDPGLGQNFQSGEFERNPEFVMQTTDREEAQELQISLRAGRLPASLNIEEGTTFELEPALAQEFKLNSLITGLIAVLAVAGTVYFRYRRIEVAAPMVVTALSEVVLLLGFAAGVGYPLDLAVIAGFIAVIGTGVDDLIIIADEVLAEGDVHSSRVFQSRFRKAFWVIGAAAATTILAMSPLAVLSLGDLRGFAIITILGVIVGVTITRPAYGDILRNLTTGRGR